MSVLYAGDATPSPDGAPANRIAAVKDKYKIKDNPMNNYSIYQITNLTDGKQYIGQSIDPARRWRHHCNKVESSYISRAIRKHGKDAFEFKILHEGLSLDEANHLEKQLIESRNTLRPHGYNIKDGGAHGNPLAGLTEEQKAERGRKISIAQTGKPIHTDETKQRISKAQKGRKRTAAERKQISESLKGRKHTAESKRKMSQAQRNMSDETKRKMGDARRGKTHTAEARRKMSEAAKRRNRKYHSSQLELRFE